MRFAIVLTTLLFVASSLLAESPLPPRATGDLYVSSFGTDEVVCFGASGEFKFRFTHADLDGPRGLAFSDAGELFVASQRKNLVLVFDPEGNSLRQFTATDLSGPTSLAFGPDGDLYVASFNGDEIIVVSQAGVESTRFTAPGLNGPNCIAFADTGDIYVASQLSNEVYRFSSQLEPTNSFTGGRLSSPMGVAIFGEEIYVTGGGSSTVTIFDLDGTYRRELSTRPEIPAPQGIAFDDSGRYVISSFSNGGVAMYATDGTLIREFDDASLNVARSVAFLSSEIPNDGTFIRGNFNDDENLDLSDAVGILGYLFLGQPAPRCLDAGDTNDDGRLDLSDAVAVLNHLFLGGAAPRAPYPSRGLDPTEDALGCAS